MHTRINRRVTVLAACSVAITVACAPTMKSTATEPITPQLLAELWESPSDLSSRDLFWGPWGKGVAPKPGQSYRVVEEKLTGFSPGFTLVDKSGQEWSVKQGPEARSEVVVSRILSALGYHQPPVYFVDKWAQWDGPGQPGQRAGRFRPKGVGIKDKGTWSWQENPFVGTDAYQGLLALMMLFNSTDLKNDNNTLYEVSPRLGGRYKVQRWYVVRDVGATLGETGKIRPTRGDPEVFAATPFILGIKDGFVDFNYRGRHQELADHLKPQDVRWMVNLVSRLSAKQWQDAFRAGGYNADESQLFINRIKEKLEQARRVSA